MRLKICHLTSYRYSSPVSENFNEVRLQPVSDERQVSHGFELITRPAARVRRYHDFHLNLVDHFHLTERHDRLEVEARSEVTTFGQVAHLAAAAFPLGRLGECLRLEHCYDFLQRSEYVSLEVQVWRLAQDAVAGLDDAWQAAVALNRFVYREFTYDPTATSASTPTTEVLRHRRGVCQDFAHVLLGLCRSVGIPARYVSGYVYTGEEMGWRGQLASHAWVEVFLPGHGWLALDPTNNRPADDHHVKVAVGRDYADAAPLRGSFQGPADQEMTIELQIQRVD